MDAHHSSLRLLSTLSPLCNCLTSAWPLALLSQIFLLPLLLFTRLSCFSRQCYLHSWDPLAGSFYENISLTFTPFLLFTQPLASFCHVLATLFTRSSFFRFAPSVCAVRVVEPLNLGSPGMPSGHMTSPCVTTVPNSLLKVSESVCMLIYVTWRGQHFQSEMCCNEWYMLPSSLRKLLPTLW